MQFVTISVFLVFFTSRPRTRLHATAQRTRQFTKAQMRKFFHTMKAIISYHVSATLIVIENRNNGLQKRKLDFTRDAGKPYVQYIIYIRSFFIN